ncbi:hypothetical protein VTK73DRAFT_1441 [Phialemonium thermophilum]|uniref:U3 small nucleolar ribonucleoprotein protein MPP10 n=1 Tax=Phialemonium thermophilum TaxID=223376 RepID=A0ABR3XAD5_9PEZI
MAPPPAATKTSVLALETTTSTVSDASPVAALLESLSVQNRHVFLRPSASLPTASLQLVKETLDAFAGQVSDEQQLRQRESSKKRKREAAGAPSKVEVLKVRKLHVDGFETGQVWQQAKRIIHSTLRESRNVLRELQERGDVEEISEKAPGKAETSNISSNASETSAENASTGESDDTQEDGTSSGEELSGPESDSVSGDEEVVDASSEVSDQSENEQVGDSESEEDEEDEEAASEEIPEDPFGLNDGFFSIDEFNKQSQWFEEQDARADPNTDQASDEEIDWHADPMSLPEAKAGKKASRKNRKNDDVEEEEEEEDDDEAGPTFGDMDLDAPEGESEDEYDKGLEHGLDDSLDLTANDIFYKDFFAPPKKKAKQGKHVGKRREPAAAQPDEADLERAMNDVRRDLFDDLSEHSDSEDALSDASAGDPKSRRSAHERRQAKLAAEIRKLEAEAVAKRAWTLSGEAAAVDRPVNSLLEEDLDFEHAGKPVPVITEEVSESIEELIKRRIIAQEFDEIIRRRPDALGDAASARRGLVELDDSKGKQSLAEIYEEEYVKKTNPDTYVSKADEKLRQEEQEVERMWKDISAKLDALSSWHYKPKPPAPTLTVVADAPTIAMEDAQPTTAQGVGGGESMVAPQEVYRAGKETAEAGEVVAKSGLPVARQEMSREEKLRRRRREKERLKKSGGAGGNAGGAGRGIGNRPASKKAQEQKDTISDLKKAGVRVINRQGEIVDVEGKKAPSQKPVVKSESFKL